jgi:hypothetical protein
MNQKKKIIIAIHGVGDTKKGEVAECLAKNLQLNAATIEQLYVNGDQFVQISTPDKSQQIIEVNWSDIMQPKQNSWSVIKQSGFIILSMMALASEQFKKHFLSNQHLSHPVFNLAGWFRIFQEALFPGAFVFALLTCAGEVITNQSLKIASFFFIFIGFSWFTWKASTHSNLYKWGWAFAIPMTLYVCSNYFFPTIHIIMLDFSLLARSVVFTSTSLLAFLIFILYAGKFVVAKNKREIASVLSFTYFPVIAYNSFATILTFLSLGFLDTLRNNHELTGWEAAAYRYIPFNMYHAEIATSIIYSAIGLLPLFGLLIYVFGFRSKISMSNKGNQNSQGLFVQHFLYVMLLIIPFLLLVLMIYLFYLSAQCNSSQCNTLNMFLIYQKAILRILPFLLWLVGPLATLTDVIGDVLFYIQPNKKAAHATQTKCLSRLNNAVTYAQSVNPDEIVIISHSWGSVVATDYFNNQKTNIKLLTLGSPVESLCKNFLNKPIPAISENVVWINAYRYGDYIAGAIHHQGVQNILIGAGGHTDYWSDDHIRQLI